MARRGKEDRLTPQELAATLRQQVRFYLPGTRLPGRADLARHFGVSTRVARQALALLAAEGIAESRSRSGTYASSQPASGQWIRRIRAIVQSWHQPNLYQQHMLLGADRACRRHGIRFSDELLIDLVQDVVLEERLGRGEDPQSVGWMLVNLIPPPQTLLSWRVRGVPFTLVDERSAHLPVNSVSADDEGAVYEATERLIRLGHSRIAFVGPISNLRPGTLSRLNGFKLALLHHGIQADPDLVWDDEIPYPNGTPEMVRDRLAGARRPTAVVCANRRIARDTLSAARQLGIAVPDELSVVSTGMNIGLDVPGLTSLTQDPPQRIGQLAVELLLNSAANPGPVTLYGARRWTEGASLGPPRMSIP
ncbi:MAG: HTH-type transcriptional repressor PurR [Phycisphaerae bacterium]|nr:HTH-type transcriptional repressor PurR [Phycisphaerae bacterium]